MNDNLIQYYDFFIGLIKFTLYIGGSMVLLKIIFNALIHR